MWGFKNNQENIFLAFIFSILFFSLVRGNKVILVVNMFWKLMNSNYYHQYIELDLLRRGATNPVINFHKDREHFFIKKKIS